MQSTLLLEVFSHTFLSCKLFPGPCSERLAGESTRNSCMLLRSRYKGIVFQHCLHRSKSILHSFCAFTGASGPTCFLAICGNSGCGKTSTVQQVCAEHNVHILEWSEDLWDADSAGIKSAWVDGGDFDATSSGRVANSNYSRSYEAQYGGGYSRTAQDLFKVEGVTWAAYTSKVK